MHILATGEIRPQSAQIPPAVSVNSDDHTAKPHKPVNLASKIASIMDAILDISPYLPDDSTVLKHVKFSFLELHFAWNILINEKIAGKIEGGQGHE